MNSTITVPSGRFATIRSEHGPLSDEQIRSVVPAIFATERHPDRTSDRYTYLPTSEIIAALHEEGYAPFMAAQSRVRDAERRAFTRHIVGLRHATASQTGRGEFNEIAVDSSHDGSRALTLRAARFRQVCGNGLVVGGLCDDIRLAHKGGIVIRDVIRAAHAITDNFSLVDASRDAMAALELTEAQRLAFAQSALELKWKPGVQHAPVRASALLKLQNYEERPSTLWSTFNIIQRNVVGGGVEGTTRSGRRTTTRPIRAIDSNTRLNRALWELAEQTRQSLS
ncbi:DUF932 domain-containing protein [Nocardia sp. NPDC051030]|uniref:DUF932 domain-containing protein n=1 Tax=Nocardia sp. NPDC051030 TaxID=3155162 RepID=UPI00344064E7